MTVSTTQNRVSYAGNGVTSAFSFPYVFFDNADLVVLVVASDGSSSRKVLGTDYTVTGAGVDIGGSVVMTAPPAAGTTLVVYRDPQMTQPQAFVDNDPLPAKSISRGFDRLTLIGQRVRELVDRSFRLSDSDTSGASPVLPSPTPNAFIGWNGVGNGLVNRTITDLITISAYGTAVADKFVGDGVKVDFTLSANPGALANLDVSISGITQEAGRDFTWDGNTKLSFVSAPPSPTTPGDTNIYARYLRALPQGYADASIVNWNDNAGIARDVQSTLQRMTADIVSVRDPRFGAVGDGATDDTAAIQKAINSCASILLPAGFTFVVDQLTVPSNRTIVVEGKLLRKPNAASDSYMFANASGAAGNSRIVITGNGELDGNAASQSGDRQGLVRFQAPTDCEFSVRKAGNNKYASTNPTTSGQGCIVFIDGVRCAVRNVRLYLWQREGIFFDGASTKCEIRSVIATGDGLNSWSAVSISGTNAVGNIIQDVIADNCGSTSAVLDSTYSLMANVISRNNQFNNGVNFGHTGKPASFSRGLNISVYNAGAGATSGTTHCGIQVGGGTTYFELSDLTVDTAYNHCVQISDSATDVQVAGANRLVNSRNGCGLLSFGANNVRVSGLTAKGNHDFGVDFSAGNYCTVVNSDLRGNTVGPFNSTGSGCTVRASRLSDDPLVGSVNLVSSGSLVAGATITVTNRNVAGFASAIVLFPRNNQAVSGLPFVQNKTSTGFVIQVGNAVDGAGGPHNVSYEII